MKKRNRINIRNLWAIVAAVAMLSTTVAQAAAVIYEPFAQTAGNIDGQAASTNGLAGNWTVGNGTVNVVTPSTMIFGALAMSDGEVGLATSPNGNARVVTNNDLNSAGLLDDGATLWFSLVFKKESGWGSNEHSGFGFGSTNLVAAFNGVALSAAGGHAFGFLSQSTSIRVAKWTDTTALAAGAGGTAAFSLAGYDTPTLIVGKIVWGVNPGSHTITLYEANADLTLNPGTELSVDYFDQSTFNTISLVQRNSLGTQTYDEIRFGATQADVLPVDTIAPTLLSFVDDQGGGPISEDVEIVTYTLTFDKHMDLSTITSNDFENVGTATATIGTITQPTPGIVQVQVLPTTIGTLQLRIPATSDIKSLAQVDLDTSSAILDDTTITINAGTTTVEGTLYWDGPTTSGVTDGASQGGTATWDTTTTNWDMGFGYAGPFAWNNSASLSAVFGGTAGTVTLGENITLSNLTFTSTGDYTIQGNSLSFAAGGLIHHNAEDQNHTFSCGISGSPDVRIRSGTHNPYNQITLSPGSVAQALGVIVSPYSVGSGDKARVTLSGSATANTIEGITYEGAGMHYGVVEVLGSGMWTVGSITNGIVDIQSGTLICNGTMDLRYSGLNPILSGARLGGNFRYIKTDSRFGWLRVNSGGVVAPGDPAISNGVGTITIQHGPYSSPSTNSFYDGSIYEWEIGASTNDTIHIVYNNSTRTLDLDNFVLKIFDAGGSPSFADQLPVFTYDIGVTIDTNGFPNTSSNFDMSEVPQWGDPADLSLVDNGTGIIYLTGLAKPPAGTVLILR